MDPLANGKIDLNTGEEFVKKKKSPKNKRKDALRKEITEKASQTRTELRKQILKGIRQDQLDVDTDVGLKPKRRISKLAALASEERKSPLDLGYIKAEDYVTKLPARWQRLLGMEFSADEWKLVMIGAEETVSISPMEPAALLASVEGRVKQSFWRRCYEDEDTMRLIFEAYKMGAADANAATFSTGILSPLARIKDLASAQSKIIEFLLADYKETINPIIELSPKELVDHILCYFLECDALKRFYTVPGLAFHIGFASREEFFEYLGSDEQTINIHIIKRALMHIEAERITDMLYGGGMMAGHKLDLATNFNYNDAGKKNEGSSTQQAPSVVVNNNILSMNTAPPKFESLEDWQRSYMENMAAKAQPKALDIGDGQAPVDIEPV